MRREKFLCIIEGITKHTQKKRGYAMFNCQLLPAKTQELFNIIKSFDIRQLSKEVGFIERVRKLCPEALIMALLTLCSIRNVSDGQDNGFDICEIASYYNLYIEKYPELGGVKVSAKDIDFQIYKPGLTVLMRTVFEKLLKHPFDSNREKICELKSELSNCLGFEISDIVLHDGCYKIVHSSLCNDFPATRKSSSKQSAQMGLQTALSLTAETITSLTITSATANERNYLCFQKGCIHICDAGYIKYELFDEATKAGALLIIKGYSNTSGTILEAKVNGIIDKSLAGKSLKSIKNLPETINIDMKVALKGKDKTAFVDSNGNTKMMQNNIIVRIIRFFDPHKGKCGFILTNIPSCVTGNIIKALLKLRWQIELFFRDLKGYNNLRAAKTTSKSLSLTFVWASLTSQLLKSIFRRSLSLSFNMEISTRRLEKFSCFSQLYKDLVLFAFGVESKINDSYKLLSNNPDLIKKAKNTTKQIQELRSMNAVLDEIKRLFNCPEICFPLPELPLLPLKKFL